MMSVSSDEGDTLHHHVSHDFTNKRAFYVQCDCSSSQAGRHFTGIKSRRLISKKYDPQPSSSSLETSLNPPSLTHVIAPVTCGQSREVGHVSKGIRRELLSRLRAFIQPLRLLLHRPHQKQHSRTPTTSASLWRTSGACLKWCAKRSTVCTSSMEANSPASLTANMWHFAATPSLHRLKNSKIPTTESCPACSW